MAAWKYEISLRVFNSSRYRGSTHKLFHFKSTLKTLFTHCCFKIDVLELKICNFVLGGDGKQHNLALVQYVFDGTEREVKVKSRGNGKTSKPFYRTSERIKHRLADTYPPKDEFHKTLEESGGILKLKSAVGHTRDVEQIKNIKQKSQEKQDDELIQMLN